MPLAEFSSKASMLANIPSNSSFSRDDMSTGSYRSLTSGGNCEGQMDLPRSPTARDSYRKWGDMPKLLSPTSQDASFEEKPKSVKSSSGFFRIQSDYTPDRRKSLPKTATMDAGLGIMDVSPGMADPAHLPPEGQDIKSRTTDSCSTPPERGRKMRQAFSSTFKFGGGSARKRRLSNNPTNTSDTAFEHTVRFATSSQLLRSEILNQCKEEKTFDVGQVVFDECTSDVKDCIMYIESGLCEWMWKGFDPVNKLSLTPTMCFTGEGAFFGVSMVLLGSKRRWRNLVARSKVVVRILRIEMQSGHLGDETDMPVCFEGFSQETSATLWEHITYDQVQKALDMKIFVNRMIKQVSTTVQACRGSINAQTSARTNNHATTDGLLFAHARLPLVRYNC